MQQAVLPRCTRPTDLSQPSYPGAMFYKRFTFPSDLQMDGVNYHHFSLDHLVNDPLPIPYDAPIRKFNGTAADLYERDAAGQYKVQKAYPDIYLLGGIGGVGEYGRELYFGFHFLRAGTADGLPSYEPYVQLGDPRTGRVSVVNVQPMIEGALRALKLSPYRAAGASFDVITTADHTTRVFLNLPASNSGLQLYDRISGPSGIAFKRFKPQQAVTTVLLWQGKVADIVGTPNSLGNQIRKFELRINYGPVFQQGKIYTSADTAFMNQFIAARSDFALFDPHGTPRFGELAVARLDNSDTVLGKTLVSASVFDTLPDERQLCVTSRATDQENRVILGDSIKAQNFQPTNSLPADQPVMLSNILPRQINMVGSIGLLASEPARFEYLKPEGKNPNTYISFPQSADYSLSVRAPGDLQVYGESGAFALDVICNKNGHYDIPVTLWDVSNPDDKKTATISADCAENAPCNPPTHPMWRHRRSGRSIPLPSPSTARSEPGSAPLWASSWPARPATGSGWTAPTVTC
jgi:hypothetical protein